MGRLHAQRYAGGVEYGLHRKGQPVRLRNALKQGAFRIDGHSHGVKRWPFVTVNFCATLEAQGINPSDFDMMIAAHAIALNVTLVSRDKAFAQVSASKHQPLRLEIW